MHRLAELRTRPYRALLASFGSAKAIASYVHSLGSGIYVMTQPTQPDQAWAVGWADYWAQRVWEVPFRGDVAAVPPRTHAIPNRDAIGLPVELTYGEILALARQQPGFGPISLHAGYRMTDGAFIAVEVWCTYRDRYSFGSNGPKKVDPPVAIEFRLSSPADLLT